MSATSMQATGELLTLVDPRQAARVRIRLAAAGHTPTVAEQQSTWQLQYTFQQSPPSTLLWLLECDDPVLNTALFHVRTLGDAIRRDILAGVPFDSARTEPVPVTDELRAVEHGRGRDQLFDLPPQTAAELIPKLRAAGAARRPKTCRSLARAVPRAEWGLVAEADAREPLPGYARWALACHVNCPQPLRARFGDHPKFAHRLRQAGILVDVEDYLTGQSAARALVSLGALLRSDSTRGRRVREELTLLVREQLGGHVEAWAVLAQLQPTFSGTLPELIVTASAIAGPPPADELEEDGAGETYGRERRAPAGIEPA